MKKSTLNFVAFITLICIALLIVIGTVLPLIGIQIGGVVVHILDTIKNLLVLLVVSVVSYDYVKDAKKAIKITYLVAVIVYVVGTILVWLV